jgi:hypothetical protein
MTLRLITGLALTPEHFLPKALSRKARGFFVYGVQFDRIRHAEETKCLTIFYLSLDLLHKPVRFIERIETMNTKAYETIQGTLSFLVLGSFTIAFTFTAEYYNLLNALDLTPWGMTYVPVIFNTAWAIFALAVIAKVWGAYVSFRFAYRIEIANKFYAIANKIDPRRN